MTTIPCDKCKGTGKRTIVRARRAPEINTCRQCNGTGSVPDMKNYHVRLRVAEEKRAARAAKTRQIAEKAGEVKLPCRNPNCPRTHGHDLFGGYCSMACLENCKTKVTEHDTKNALRGRIF